MLRSECKHIKVTLLKNFSYKNIYFHIKDSFSRGEKKAPPLSQSLSSVLEIFQTPERTNL